MVGSRRKNSKKKWSSSRITQRNVNFNEIHVRNLRLEMHFPERKLTFSSCAVIRITMEKLIMWSSLRDFTTPQRTLDSTWLFFLRICQSTCPMSQGMSKLGFHIVGKTFLMTDRWFRLARFLETAGSVLNYFEPFLGRIEIMGGSHKIERVYFEIKESNIEQWEKPQIKVTFRKNASGIIEKVNY